MNFGYYTAILTAIVMVACSASSQVQTKLLGNAEFGFQVSVPAQHKICIAKSDMHPHGIYFSINSTDICTDNRDNTLSVISLYAGYNSAFFRSAEEVLPHNCEHWREISNLRTDEFLKFPSYASANCVRRNKDGTIDIYVTAQAKKWPGGAGLSSAYVNYIASLHTSPNKISRDIVEFANFLENTHIGR